MDKNEPKTQWKKQKCENFEGRSNIKQKIENYKKIPVFENIYEKKNPVSFNESTHIIEDQDQEQCEIDIATEAEIQKLGSRLDSSHITTASLSQGISDSLAKINNFDNIPYNNPSVINNNMNYVSNDSPTPMPSMSESAKTSSAELKIAIESFMNVIKTFFMRIIGLFSLISQYLQYFILNYHIYYTKFMTSIANGLTGGTATTTELNIFMTETQKLLTLLLVWVFVYNWYYIVFFLDKEYKWTFNADQLKNYSFAYMLLEPSVRVVEIANTCLVTFPSKIKRYLNKEVIFILLILIFWLLTSTNFQSSLIYDFFASLSYLKFFKSAQLQKTPSIVTIFTTIIVVYYGLKHFVTGTMTGYSFDLLRSGGMFGFALGLMVLIVSFCVYMAYLILVNVPLGVIFMFTYLLMYTFFAILIYEGPRCFSMISSISEDISILYMEPEGSVYDEPTYYSIQSWLTWLPSWFYRKMKYICYISLKYIFEIVLILNLLGGISTYATNYKTTSLEKSAIYNINVKPSSGIVRSAFKNLFTWLILINILIIILLSIFITQKRFSKKRCNDNLNVLQSQYRNSENREMFGPNQNLNPTINRETFGLNPNPRETFGLNPNPEILEQNLIANATDYVDALSGGNSTEPVM